MGGGGGGGRRLDAVESMPRGTSCVIGAVGDGRWAIWVSNLWTDHYFSSWDFRTTSREGEGCYNCVLKLFWRSLCSARNWLARCFENRSR